MKFNQDWKLQVSDISGVPAGKPNVLILVLSARREPWGDMMKCSMETWDSVDHSQAITRYYCGKYDGDSDYRVWNSPNFDESLEQVAPRTMEAYELALGLPNWDFMARTHSSTYVHKTNLVNFIEALPKENVLCGLMVTGERPFLWGGGSYIMSRDVVEKLVASKDKWNNNIMEDNALTDLANELQIPMMGNGRMASINIAEVGWSVMPYGIGEGFTFTDWNDVKKIHPHFYIRCKQDLKRHLDLVIMRELFAHL